MANLREKPLVSIVIPCFNQRRFLPTLFGSLLDQTYENIEIIFLDDASPDGSGEGALDYKDALLAKFPRVYLETNACNLGVLKNLKKGFAMASGEFLCYLEADDYYRRDKIERNLEFFELNPSYGVVHSDYFQVNNDFRVVPRFAKRHQPGPSCLFNSGWIFDELLVQNIVCAPSLLVRRDFFLRAFQFDLFEERKYNMADYPALLNLSQVTKIGYIDEPLVFDRVPDVSMSHRPVSGEQRALLERIETVRRDASWGRLKPLPLVSIL